MPREFRVSSDDAVEVRATNIVNALPIYMSAETRATFELDVLRLLLLYERLDKAAK